MKPAYGLLRVRMCLDLCWNRDRLTRCLSVCALLSRNCCRWIILRPVRSHWRSAQSAGKGWSCNGWVREESTRHPLPEWLHVCPAWEGRPWHLVQSDHWLLCHGWRENKITPYSQRHYETKRNQPQILREKGREKCWNGVKNSVQHTGSAHVAHK